MNDRSALLRRSPHDPLEARHGDYIVDVGPSMSGMFVRVDKLLCFKNCAYFRIMQRLSKYSTDDHVTRWTTFSQQVSGTNRGGAIFS